METCSERDQFRLTTNEQEVTIDGGATPEEMATQKTQREDATNRMLVEENLEVANPTVVQSAAEVAAEQDNNYK